MRIAFSSIITGESLDVAVLAKTAEGLGYDSFWVGEHPIFPVVNTDGGELAARRPGLAIVV